MDLGLPWSASRHPDPLVGVLYIVNSEGIEICSFYGDFDRSAQAIKAILAAVNPKAEVAEEGQ